MLFLNLASLTVALAKCVEAGSGESQNKSIRNEILHLSCHFIAGYKDANTFYHQGVFVPPKD
jgi:hypothetical protein